MESMLELWAKVETNAYYSLVYIRTLSFKIDRIMSLLTRANGPSNLRYSKSKTNLVLESCAIKVKGTKGQGAFAWKEMQELQWFIFVDIVFLIRCFQLELTLSELFFSN